MLKKNVMAAALMVLLVQFTTPLNADEKQELGKELTPQGCKASSFYKTLPPKGLLLKHSKKWAARGKTGKPQWIELSFNKKTTITGVVICQPPKRLNIKKFKLQYDDNGTWKTIKEGENMGITYSVTFPAIETTKIRLLIEDFVKDPGLNKFKLYQAL